MTMNVGDRARVKDTYAPYKSMRGMVGTLTWITATGHMALIETDTVPPWPRSFRDKTKNWCYVTPEDIEILEAKA